MFLQKSGRGMVRRDLQPGSNVKMAADKAIPLHVWRNGSLYHLPPPYHAIMDLSHQDLQPGSNVKFVTEEEGIEGDKVRFVALI